MNKGTLLTFSTAIYRLLLRVYPRADRERFGDPMATAFEERCAEQIEGLWTAIRVWCVEYPNLLYRAARERLGGNGIARHEDPRKIRMTGRAAWIDPLLQDAGHAIRLLRRRPTYTLVVFATLVLGIGMNTAIFSVVYGVLLQPLPFADPERLVQVGRASPDGDTWLNPISPAEFRDLAGRLRLVAPLAGISPSGSVLTDAEEPELVRGGTITTELFDLLGISPQMGRFFEPADADPGAEHVVVLSDAFWKKRLGAVPDVLGSSVELGGTPYTVVGVAPPGFAFRPGSGLSGAEYWEPLRWTDNALRSRHNHFLMLYGRLAPGASVEAASAEVFAAWREVVAGDPGNHLDASYELGLRAVPLRQFNVISSRDPLMFLGGAVALILLIACANVANLMLANAESRRHELAVRAAIGAGRGRLLRQFLTEAFVLTGTGGLLGMLIAILVVRSVLATFPNAVPRAGEVGLNLPVLGYAAGISLLTAMALGLVTSLQVRGDDVALRESGRGHSDRTPKLRKALVVAEVALALMLVIGAGLLIKSYQRATNIDLGFDAEGLLAVNLTLPPQKYQDSTAYSTFYEAFTESLLARPGVEAVGMTSLVPIRSFGYNISGVTVEGHPEQKASYVEIRYVTPAYHDTLGVPVVRGRGFTSADITAQPPPVLINETLARRLFGDGDPIGQRIASQPPAEIVGVVGDLRAFGPDRELAPYLYVPAAYSNNLMARVHGDLATVVPEIRRVVREIDPDVRVWRVEPMDTIARNALGNRRFQLILMTLFAVVAVVLGAVGTYGVLAYTIEGQMHDFGIRIAVGARARDIRRLVLRGAGSLAAIGVAIGLIGAFALRRFVASMLFEVDASDSGVYASVTLAMVAIAAVACWVPARRAASADPVEVLHRQ